MFIPLTTDQQLDEAKNVIDLLAVVDGKLSKIDLSTNSYAVLDARNLVFDALSQLRAFAKETSFILEQSNSDF